MVRSGFRWFGADADDLEVDVVGLEQMQMVQRPIC